MSELKKYILDNDKKRVALVGANSQGKSHALLSLNDDKELKGSVIFVDSETKPDENMKNSTDSTTLIDWITQLIGIEKINNVLDEVIKELNIDNSLNGISINVEKSVKSYKGLIKFDTKTKNNKFNNPGSGEKSLGQLIMIENILKNKESSKYKWLLLDEPESYLHPSLYPLIAKTLNKISEYGIRVVIATHSPEILKYFIDDLSEIIRMKDGEMYPLNTDSYYSDIIKNISIYTDKALMMESFERIKDMSNMYFQSIIKEDIIKSIFADVVILGEGIAEEEIFKFFVKKYPEFYYENNINTIVIYGKCFVPWYVLIYKEIGIKTLAIYDCDENKKHQERHIEINSLIEKNSTSTLKIYDKNGIKKMDIEDYLELEVDDKTKHLISVLREKWLENDNKLINFLCEIKEQVEDLIKNIKK